MVITILEAHVAPDKSEALETMRQSGQTPRGVLMFRAAEAEPTLSISNVATHAVAAA